MLMAKDQKKRKPSPFTLAPLYLAAGLAVCFLVLTKMVPAMNTIVDEKVKAKQPEAGGWHEVVLGISNWVCAHQSVCITAFAIVGIAGFVLPFLIRPARYLVWAFALAVFLIDVALAGGGYWNMISGLLKEANNLNR